MGWTPLMYASSASEFQDCLVELIAYILAFLLVRFLLRVFGKRLARLPSGLCWLLIILDICALEIPWYPLFSGNLEKLFVGGLAATINLGLLGLIPFFIFFLFAILYFTSSESHAAAQRKSLLRSEMELQHSYYQELYELQRPIRELRHDLANHLAVMEQFCQNQREDRLKQYEASLLSLCQQLDEKTTSAARWRGLNLSGLADRETYILYSCISDLLKTYQRTWEDIRLSRREHQLVLSVLKEREGIPAPSQRKKGSAFSRGKMDMGSGGRKAALQKALNKDSHFQLIRSIIADHKWKLVLGEDGDTWSFTLNF